MHAPWGRASAYIGYRMKSEASCSVWLVIERKCESNMSELRLLSCGTDQAPSPLPPPQVDQSPPMVAMPGPWAIHCVGCRTPAPETFPEEMSGNRSTAGCRCLMCLDWYSCLACAQEQRAAHRDLHPSEEHVTYCVTPADEQAEVDGDLTSTIIPRWSFVFQSLVWPFLKMFIPCVSVLFQVCRPDLATRRARAANHSFCADVLFSD
jgi:hypothetical protein